MASRPPPPPGPSELLTHAAIGRFPAGPALNARVAQAVLHDPYGPVPDYSGDDGEALAFAARRLSPWFHVAVSTIGEPDAVIWQAELYSRQGGRYYQARAETPALALCRAALLTTVEP